MDIEAQWLFPRIVLEELDGRSVGDNFVDDKLGVLRLKGHVAAKRRNEYMTAFGS